MENLTGNQKDSNYIQNESRKTISLLLQSNRLLACFAALGHFTIISKDVLLHIIHSFLTVRERRKLGYVGTVSWRLTGRVLTHRIYTSLVLAPVS